MVDHQEIDERISKCEKILSANPGSQIFAALAEAHRRKGDLDTAFKVCQKGLKSHPKYGSAHVVMAKINLDKGLYDWAETEVEKASKQGGNVHAIELIRCEILISKGELEQAERQLRKLLKKEPDNSQLNKLMETLDSIKNRPLSQNLPGEVKFPGDVAVGLATRSQRKKSRPLGAKVEGPSVEPLTPEEQIKKPKAAVFVAGDMLDEGVGVDGVFGALWKDNEGELFDSRWGSDEREEAWSSVACEIYRNVTGTMERVAFGSCETVLVDSKGVKIYFLFGTDEHFVFFAEPTTNTNRLRANLNRIWKAYDGNPRRDSSAKGV